MDRRSVNLIVVHCSATPSGRSIAHGRLGEPGYLNAARVIDAWHVGRGFKRAAAARAAFNPDLAAIGYHFVIDLTGEVWTGRGLDEVGAHAAGFNSSSVGVCLVGGAEPAGGRYTAEQWKSLRRLAEYLSSACGVPLTPAVLRNGKVAVAGICGHRDLSPDLNGNGVSEPREWLKTCPGFDVRTWLMAGRRALDAHLITLEKTP